MVHSSISYNSESKTLKAPLLLNPGADFYIELQSSVFGLPRAYESLGKPPGRATEQPLARVDFAESTRPIDSVHRAVTEVFETCLNLHTGSDTQAVWA